ncbi:MAG: DHH family phosphoesterase, partial [Spirochaetota bacterium]
KYRPVREEEAMGRFNYRKADNINYLDGENLSEKVFSSLSGCRRLLIVIKGSPDPDVLASSFALSVFCKKQDIEATIVSLREVSLLQNKTLIQRADIPVHFIKKIYSVDDYDSYAVLDHQSAWVDDIGTKIPCVLHIDHHAEEEDRIIPLTRIISEEAGSVSTLMALILREKNPDIEPALLKRLATALIFGIRTDTDALNHSSPLDREAADWLIPRIDADALSEMENTPYSEETVTVISKAVMNEYFYKDWLFCGVGYVPEIYRDSIAITADYLIQNEDVSGVVIFALIERENKGGLFLDASIRTSQKSLDINRFVKYITPEGGGRTFKGAYQVNLDYFTACPDRGMIWEEVKITTIERLKRGRDHITALTLEGSFIRFRKKVTKIFTPWKN